MKVYALATTYGTDEKLYFVSCNFNALFCVDMKDWATEYVTSFEEYTKEQTHLFKKGIMQEDRIYFMPYYANHIVAYNPDNHLKEYIKIGDESAGVIDSFIDGKDAWLFMMSYPNRIVKADLNVQKIEERGLDWGYIFEATGMKDSDLTDLVKKYTILRVHRCADLFWIVLYNIPGILLTYDIRTNKTEVHKIKGMENEVFSAVVALEDCVWINITNKKRLVRWEEDTNRLDVIEYEAVDADEEQSVMAHIGNYIIIAREKELISLDRRDCRCKTMYYSEKTAFRSCERIENRMVFYPYEGGDRIVIFDADKNEISEHRLKWKKWDVDSLKEWYGGFISDERGVGLDEFLDVLCTQQEIETSTARCGSVGSSIWEEIRK